MNHAPEYECNQRNDPTEHEHTNDIQATEDHTARVPELDDNNKTVATSSTLQNTVPKHQQQTCSDDQRNQRDTDNENLAALESERQAPRPEEQRERDNNGGTPSIQLPEYRDDRDSAIIHLGVIGTHEGKTFIPKRSVHRNALDDLAHPYGEDQDFFVLDVNLDGDQIDNLLYQSKICDARDQRNAYQNSTT